MSIATDILPYIPQRPPFVMVQTLEHCDADGASTRFQIPDDHLFISEGVFKEPGLIENIAQTAAARIGYICSQENRPVPIGFIGAVQQLRIDRLPAVGEVLNTTISVKNQIFNATIVNGTVAVADTIIASCEMRIFIAE
ncbi:3-hydroxyacyl-ACP dehydratase [Niabella ginsenosidivorans]|uniref:3-hydroxyacyl-ACP dehydratase n=1 Tax=Niabella ginsenosidivorans TaxID=1176587 RepID=A0A1A9I5G5_9BACT|nr:3-hydroxyacyl-ACP dehydratase [Niabella ginsenosidivorans]ANH82908.1 3-hydroxyacyl-ACP dehydratase [Niabella ginsenosidivorans]